MQKSWNTYMSRIFNQKDCRDVNKQDWLITSSMTVNTGYCVKEMSYNTNYIIRVSKFYKTAILTKRASHKITVRVRVKKRCALNYCDLNPRVQNHPMVLTDSRHCFETSVPRVRSLKWNVRFYINLSAKFTIMHISAYTYLLILHPYLLIAKI